MYLNESRAKAAESCLRKFYFLYLLGGDGVRLVGRNVGKRLVWGTMLHAGLAAHYSDDPDYEKAIISALNDSIPELNDLDALTQNEWHEEARKIVKIVNRYAEHYGDENLSVVAVEAPGAVRLGDSHHWFVYRVDLIVMDGPGLDSLRIWDHKSTSGGADQYYLASWEFSSQMWGYCYGTERSTGRKVGGYTVNIIRDVKAAVEAPDFTKTCPECKNGKNKRVGCPVCFGEGRVPRPPKPADQAFMRAEFSFTEDKAESFVAARERLADKIERHQERLDSGDMSAFPRNPSQCHSCIFTEICPTVVRRPLSETFVPEDRYVFNGPDYVSLKRMQDEEKF